MFETLRLTPAPFRIPRKIMDNNENIAGYKLPKNSFMFAAYTNICKNGKYGRELSRKGSTLANSWNASFDINNFLSNSDSHDDEYDTTFCANDIYLNVAFGMGPRNCPGQKLGIRMLSTMFGFLVYNYVFELTEETRKRVRPPFSIHHMIIHSFDFIVERRVHQSQ